MHLLRRVTFATVLSLLGLGITIWNGTELLAGAEPTGRERVGSAAECGASVEGQSLSISTSKAVYAPGEQIILNVRLKNFGTTDVTEARHGPIEIISLYSIGVSLEHDRAVPMTTYALEQVRRFVDLPGSGRARTLKPDEDIADETVLSWFFDFSRSGKYTITAKRKVMKANGDWSSVEAVSNRLTISVDEELRYRSQAGPHDPPSRQYTISIPDFDVSRWHMDADIDAPVKARAAVAADLIAQAQKGKTRNARTYGVYLLGELRADEAVPTLLTLIDFEGVPDHNSNSRHARWGRYPACEALAKIGSPAVGLLVGDLADEGSASRRRLVVGTLRDILGKDVAEFVLKKADNSATGPRKANYEQAIRDLDAGGL